MVLVVALFLISIQVILFAIEFASPGMSPELDTLLEQPAGTHALPAGEDAADEESGESPSLREIVTMLATREPGVLGFIYVLLFLLAALPLVPDLFPWAAQPVRTRNSLLVNTGLYLACGIPFLFAGYCALAVVIMNILYTIILAGESWLRVKKKRSSGRIALRSVILLLAAVNLVLFITQPIFVLAVMIIRAFAAILHLAFSQIRLDILRKIIRKTYASEVLLGMFLLIVAFSIVLSLLDPGIASFGDALWYCFATVTTIGYGDVTTSSLTGRILGVILGIYGIVVVALVTSIIVNFYNETKSEKDPAPVSPEPDPDAENM